MARTKIDITGQQFDQLTVLSPAESRGGQSRWHCRCTCGNIITAWANNLKAGITRHCGAKCPKQFPRKQSSAHKLKTLRPPPTRMTIKSGEIQVNDKFGWLCVTENPDNSKVTCYCGCDAMSPVVVYRNRLLAGQKTTCGHCDNESAPFRILEGRESALVSIEPKLESMGYNVFREIATKKILWQSSFFPTSLDSLPVHYRFQRFDTVWIPKIRKIGLIQNITDGKISVKLADEYIQNHQVFTPGQLFLVGRAGLDK